MNILKASRWTAASLLAVGSLYACAPHAVQPTPTGALCRTEAYFSRRGGAAPALINVLDQAQTSIHAAMYGLTKAQIVDALLAAKRRGVDVALKTDKIENAGKAQAAVIAKLQAAGVPVEISEQARLPYCYGPRPVFAAEALIPSSSQTPVRATDKDGTPVYIGDKNISAIRIVCPDGTVTCLSSINNGTINIPGNVNATVTIPGLTISAVGQQDVTTNVVALPSNAGKAVCFQVLDGTGPNVYWGLSSVTTSTGWEIVPGASQCLPVSNSSQIYVRAASTGSRIAYAVLN